MIRINSVSFLSLPGPRPNQEDYIVASADTASRVFVLCDGMGGHGHGEVASRTVAESVHGYLAGLNPSEYTPDDIRDAVDRALADLAEADVYHDEKAMGTTLVVVAINRMNVLVGHIGDSRCYEFSSDGIIKFRTRDHSKVQEAVEAEILTEEEAWSSPHKNKLTRCILSTSRSVTVDVDTLTIADNDILLLCSDGVTDAMRDAEIQSVIVGRQPAEIVESIRTACELSSRDNFSMILLSLSQDEPEVVEEKPAKRVTGKDAEADTKTCPVCGATISRKAEFCPKCGRPVSVRALEQTSGRAEKPAAATIIDRLSSVNPLYLILGGAVAGALAVWAFSGVDGGTHQAIKADNADGASDASTVFAIDEPVMTGFITDACDLSDATTLNDSIIYKESLLNEYKEFLDDLHKK